MSKSLHEVTAGDKVYITTSTFAVRTAPLYKEVTVERTTQRLIIVSGYGRFRRFDGHQPGKERGRLRIKPITEKTRAAKERADHELRRLDLAREISAKDVAFWKRLPLVRLQQIKQLLTNTEEGADHEQTTSPTPSR